MFENMFSVHKLFNLLLITTMIYQLIHVTLNYRQYRTIIKTELEYFESGDLPSLTFCRRDHDWRFEKKEKVNDEYKSIEYEFGYNNDILIDKPQQKWKLHVQLFPIPISQAWDDDDYYASMTDVMITNVSSLKCVTLFSKLQLNSSKDQHKVKIRKPTIYIVIYDEKRNVNYYLSAHPANQLLTSMAMSNMIPNATLTYFNLDVKTEYSLPLPYDTKCVNYEDNIGKDKDAYKSMKECEDERKIMMNSSSQFKSNELISKKLENECPNDCKREIFYFHLVGWSGIEQYSGEGERIIQIKRVNRDENLYHLPEITFISYLCSIGGIMSMWIGISVMSEGRRIFNMFLAIKIKLSKSSDSEHYTNKYIPMLYIVICIIISSLQTYDTFSQFFNYEYIIRLSSDIKLQFPSIQLFQRTNIDLHNLYKDLNATNQEGRKILIEDIFRRIIRIDCQILQNKQSIPCDQYYHYDEYYNLDGDHLNGNINRFTLMQSIARRINESNQTNNLQLNIEDKPRIEFDINYYSYYNSFTMIQFIEGDIGDGLMILAENGYRYDISFTQRSIELLPSPYSTDCLKYPTDAYISEHACYKECISRLWINIRDV